MEIRFEIYDQYGSVVNYGALAFHIANDVLHLKAKSHQKGGVYVHSN